MPNWAFNTVKIYSDKKEDLDNFFEKHFTKDKHEIGAFDFNTIIKMPEVLTNTLSSGRTYENMLVYCEKNNIKLTEEQKNILIKKNCASTLFKTKRFEDYYKENSNNESLLAEGECTYKAFSKTGYLSWYDWCLGNWGTKWNACEAYCEGPKENPDSGNYVLDIFFDTAWSMPMHIYNKLRKMYPEFKFDINVEYEDIYGDGIDTFVMEGGELVRFIHKEVFDNDDDNDESDDDDELAYKFVETNITEEVKKYFV